MAEVITSAGNARVKAIRALRLRKERVRTSTCYVEGIRPVAEAVQSGAPIQTVVVAPGLLNSDFGLQTVDEARLHGVPLLEVSPAVFRSLSERDGPQGLAAVVEQVWEGLDDARCTSGDTWVALDEMRDPGNLGTVLRTCDAAGACGVILLEDSADPYDPAAVRASMGAVFTQRLVRTSFAPFVDWARHEQARVVGTSARADAGYRDAEYGERTVLLVGSERAGLSDTQRAACDLVVRIPMLGRASSLNAAVATGILLYEVLQHRGTSAR
ncbi:MAG: RNA methyltransferase [Dehalococcoidia bacterium]|nr:RNA methyltransferase [Dehalococcoidia bacterium]